MSNHRLTVFIAVFAVAATTMDATQSAAKSGRTISTKRDLASTGVDADARGEARLSIRARSGRLEGKLEVSVRNLESRATYEVSLDGVHIGELTTASNGRGRVRFRSVPRGHDLLLGADPRGRDIVVSSTVGAVLGATVPDDSVDPAKIRCCFADDSGPECEDRTPGECVAQGGIDLGPGTCLPNPCEGLTPPPPDADILCCLADDSGPECEDRTPVECALQGGVNVGDGTCLPNPCEGTPLPPELEDVRCCLPDDSGTECEDRTAAECEAQGGVDLGPGSCLPNPCAALPSPGVSPSPDDSPSPQVSPSPEDSPSPDDSPSPQVSPSPEDSPSPDDSSSPQVSPSPDDSPSPEDTPSPDNSVSPAVSPTPVPG